MVESILVPTDGSRQAAEKIRQTIAYAQRESARVHALFVVDTKRYGEPALSSMEVLLDTFEDAGREHLAALVDAGERQGVVVEPHCSRGDPTTKIVETANELAVDVVVPCLEGIPPEKLCRHGLDPRMIEPYARIVDNGLTMPV
ncbi:MAG: universal stress protein [archaeon]